MARRASPRVLFTAPLQAERRFLSDALRQETVGGAILLGVTLVALAWANSPWHDSYDHVRHLQVGPLTLERWAADGLLTLFFYVAGLELKRELVTGSLRHLSRALVPVVAAVAGMVVPTLFYLGMVLGLGDASAVRGWAVPMATDIAFALALLAVAGSALPPALRAFLLTLAVVDDIGAITVIAVFFTSSLDFAALALAVVLSGVYAVLQHRRVRAPLVYLPLVISVWWMTYQSGIHATVAGVALGLLTRVRPDHEEASSPAERLEHRLRPWSAGVAVPFFALAAAGVPLTAGALGAMSIDAAALGVIVGLVAGKAVGVFAGAWLTARVSRASLSPDLAWWDIFGVAILSGVGFTVCLLIADLAFGDDPSRLLRIKAAVLIASLLAGLVGALVLRVRHRVYRAASTVECSEDTSPG